ncbi:Ceramide glucosyltransferase [Kosakonia sp. BK9b]
MMLIALSWLAILLFKLVFALRVMREQATAAQGELRRLTVAQPILSGDPALESVLESALMALSGAQFIWLIDEDDAEAAAITARIVQRHPQCAVRIIVTAAPPQGINPKLFKLERARAVAQTEIFLVLDDDALLSARSASKMIGELRDNSLVTALPWYRPAHNLPSRLLAQFVNDNSPLTYLPLVPFCAPLTLNGMCYMLPLALLQRIGGFAPIERHLTDDLALATHLTRQGGEIIQSAATVRVQTSIIDVGHYNRQMHRWFLFATLLLREKSVATRLAIFLLQGLHPLLMWAMVILALTGLTPALVLAAVLLIRHLALRWIQRQVAVEITPHPLLSLLSELLQPLHLLHALCNRTITWRTRRYRIYSNERFTSL